MPNDVDTITMFQAMAKGIQHRGKAEIGEKTMVDAWLPAAEAAGAVNASGGSFAACLTAAADAARTGAAAIKDMMAGKGRPARLGERSIGHIDGCRVRRDCC